MANKINIKVLSSPIKTVQINEAGRPQSVLVSFGNRIIYTLSDWGSAVSKIAHAILSRIYAFAHSFRDIPNPTIHLQRDFPLIEKGESPDAAMKKLPLASKINALGDQVRGIVQKNANILKLFKVIRPSITVKSEALKQLSKNQNFLINIKELSSNEYLKILKDICIGMHNFINSGNDVLEKTSPRIVIDLQCNQEKLEKIINIIDI